MPSIILNSIQRKKMIDAIKETISKNKLSRVMARAEISKNLPMLNLSPGEINGIIDASVFNPATATVAIQRAKATSPFEPPKLRPELHSGTGAVVDARQRERITAMKEAYPGVEFSMAGTNPLGVAEGKAMGQPGVGIPRAVFNNSIQPISDPRKIQLVTEALKKWGGSTGHVTYNNIKFETGLSFEDVFGVCKHLHNIDPYGITFGVDRLGKNTQAKLVKLHERAVKK
jgi:hypothetical protein